MADPSQAPTRGGTLSSLRYPGFRYLWLGQVCHASAVWMSQVALPFLIFDITGDKALHLGGVIGLRTVPQVLFGLIAGVVSDWFDRRRILLGVKSAVLLVAVVFAGLIGLGRLELWHVYAYALARGLLMAFDQPARQSLIPSLVPAERVTNAMALMSATLNTMRIAGAALGGLAYHYLGAAGAFSTMALLYLGTLVCTYLMRVATHDKPAEATLSAMAAGLVEGLRYAASSPPVRGVLALGAIYFTFGMSYMQVLLPLFAEQVLGIGSAGYGVLSSCAGAGALLMALVIARLDPERLGLILPATVMAFGLAAMGCALGTYLPRPLGLGLAFGLIAVIGAVQTAFLSLGRVLLLHSAPEAMRGRMLSLLSLDRALMSAGAAGGGVLAAAVGVRHAQLLYGLLCLVGGSAVYLLATEFRRARTPEVAPAPR